MPGRRSKSLKAPELNPLRSRLRLFNRASQDRQGRSELGGVALGRPRSRLTSPGHTTKLTVAIPSGMGNFCAALACAECVRLTLGNWTNTLSIIKYVSAVLYITMPGEIHGTGHFDHRAIPGT